MRTFLILLFVFVITVVCCSALGVHEGGNVVLGCYVPTSTRRTSPVYWYTYTFSEYLSEDYRVTIERNLTSNLLNRLSVVGDNGDFNIKISNITLEDGGEYSCGYYTSGNRWVTVAIENIIIQDPMPPDSSYPLCATEPSDQFYPGMEVRLICISRGGSPPATLTWYREGIPLQTTSNEFEGYHERTLTSEDNGVAFVCKSTSLGVDTVKECSLTPLRLVPHVRVYSRPDPVTIGENVEFTCMGEGEPSIATYVWYWNGQLITENDRLIITGNSGDVLILNSVQPEDNNALILCVVTTYTDLRNTDHVRLRIVDNSVLPDMTTGKQHLSILPGAGAVSNHDSSVPLGAVFGCIIAGILITLLVFGLYKAGSIYKNRHHGNMDFNMISLNHLNNFRHNQTRNEEELTQLNQTHNNKTCNLGNIDIVATTATASGGIDTDYAHIPDKDCRKGSFHSDHKQIEEPYANANFKTNSQIDNQTYFTVDSTTKDLSANNLDPITPNHVAAADKISDYEFPHQINPTETPRVRCQTAVTQAKSAGHYQRSSRRKMPKIHEDSNTSLQRRNLAHSLPDLTPSSCFVSMPINIDFDHHDYVNMGVTSPTTRTPDYHDYVNYTHDVGARNPIARSDSSSSGYDEEPDSPRLRSASPSKKISYAELDFTEHGVNSGSTENILQTCPIPSSANGEECEQTSYSQIAYVFKDRRQQSVPSVQRIFGVTR
ncbi:uncharacterized protein [Amphiura filiformis]|uniref:uncharacterized protein n=1 Tax=Amphiura filiformis TaxID=82378 RepID=UPI003B228C8E